MGFTLQFTVPKISAKLKGDVPARTIETVSIRAVNEAIIITNNRMIEVSPVGVTSNLKQGWQKEPARKKRNKEVVGVVKNEQVQALVIDEGARPHFPPFRPISLWVQRKLGEVDKKKIVVRTEAIRRKIGARGLRKKQTFTNAFRKLENRISGIMKTLEKKIADLLVD